MQFCSLGSGSKGNATLIQTKRAILLIDCGFSLKELTKRLLKFNLTPDKIDAILVTHEHQDHISGVGVLSRKFNTPIWGSAGTLSHPKLHNTDCRVINIHQDFSISDCEISPVAVPHDAKEPCQFIIQSDGLKLGILTDVGRITSHIIDCFHGCHGLLLETNHDTELLQQGQYPPSLKIRVGGDYGHLNNQQAGKFIQKVDTRNLKKLVLMHISQHNNQINLAKDAIVNALKCPPDFPIVADQDLGFDWLKLSA